MQDYLTSLADRLATQHRLQLDEYRELIDGRNEALAKKLAEYAVIERKKHYGNHIYVRGLIEISNVCKNDCLYCGIRCSNTNCSRYRLSPDEILECCHEGYKLGFRTFVLQGGEDPFFSDDLLCCILEEIKGLYPDCAVTLSLGERSRESYARLKAAGADRYLLRHETATAAHYGQLHPGEMSFENRIRCLNDLKELGFQTGCGFMVGSPFQTTMHLARDLQFVEEFQPQMCGIGPFIPHCDTPFGNEVAGTAELTCYLLSILRLIQPKLLLPATTALDSVSPQGRTMGILAGANVIMPNLSPQSVRKKYMLYNNKATDGLEGAEYKKELDASMASIGYEIVTHRGDAKQ